MCRNIRTLHNFDPPTTPDEIHAAALQYVRKVAGCTRPSRVNTEAFDQAVHEVAHATERLLSALVPGAAARTRDAEASRARERWQRRLERMGTA